MNKSAEPSIHIEEVTYGDILPDNLNANRGTDRGRAALRDSIESCGFLEAGTIDVNNRLIGGNKRTSAAKELGLGAPIVIDIDGTRPIYLRRNNIDLDTPEGRKAALALNRVAQLNIDLDPEIIQQYQEMGAQIESFYDPGELDTMLSELGKLAAAMKTKETPQEKQNDAVQEPVPERFLVIVTCDCDAQQAELLERLTEEGLECRALVS